LEAGLLGTPSVLAYRFHPLSFPIVRWMSNLPPERYYIGLVNILAGEELFPELVQDRVKPERLAREIRRLIEDDSRRGHVQRGLRDIRRSLGEPRAGGKGCFERAAEIIAKLVGS
jgi:lipid-A-disaccharide synthase